MDEQARIVLRPKWESVAIRVGARGMNWTGAYAEVYPNASNPSAASHRLRSNHPEIEERIQQLRDVVEDKATDFAAMGHQQVQEALLENIEDAKSHGRAIISKTKVDGEWQIDVSWERNHSAINQALKIIADINGLTIKAKKDRGRGEDDTTVELSPDQLLASVLRRYAESKGMKIDQLSRHALSRIALAAGARLPAGELTEAEITDIRSIPEAEDVPREG